MSLGSKLLELRTAKNLSQSSLSDLLDVSRQSISKWETDAAVPDLDKLMKLCDVFDVTLDELTERTVQGTKEASTVVRQSRSFSAQKIVGFLLLGFSLIVGLLLLFWGANIGDFLILTPISAALLLCGMLCLLQKRHVLYWCIWTAFAPILLVTPHVVGFGTASTLFPIQICFFVGMIFAANHFFKGDPVATGRQKSLLLAILWLGTILMHLLNFPVTSSGWLLSFLWSFGRYTWVAVLETYTVRYFLGKKR